MPQIGQGVMVNGTPTADPVTVFYNGADAISEGMGLCYDVFNATAANRYYYVVKPTLKLLQAGAFAGYVNQGQKRSVADGTGEIDIIPWDGQILRGASVLTDENVAVGDLLAPIPESYNFGKAVHMTPVFRVTTAVDGSTTASLVIGDYGANVYSHQGMSDKFARFFDDFVGLTTIAAVVANAVADQTTWLLTGTTAAATYKDNNSIGATDAAVAATQKGNGILRLTPTTTTQANITLNGEAFALDVGKSLMFRVRFALNDVTTGTVGAFLGISLTDTAFIASLPTDYMGFTVAGTGSGLLTFNYVKDGTGGLVTSATLATLAADTFVEATFLIRNRGAGGMSLAAWVDTGSGPVLGVSTVTSTEVVDNESLTCVIETKGAEAHILDIDRVEIVNSR